MLVLPVYDLLLLPGVTFNFKKDVLERMQVEKVEKGEEILFLIQKEEKKREDLIVDDFQEKGLVGTVENVDDEGNISIRVHNRVDVSDIEITDGAFTADAAICSEIADLPEEEEKEIYKELKNNNITQIIVTHRLSTIKDADYIYLIEQGEIVEQGMHKDLIETEGMYAKMWKEQN